MSKDSKTFLSDSSLAGPTPAAPGCGHLALLQAHKNLEVPRFQVISQTAPKM
jgi:hypothetical protein